MDKNKLNLRLRDRWKPVSQVGQHLKKKFFATKFSVVTLKKRQHSVELISETFCLLPGTYCMYHTILLMLQKKISQKEQTFHLGITQLGSFFDSVFGVSCVAKQK
jgi:hypothetical protein